MLTYLSSSSVPHILAALYALREYSITAEIENFEDLIIDSKLGKFLCLRLLIHEQFKEKIDYTIVYEILWILINFLSFIPKRKTEYLHELVEPELLQCLERLLIRNDYSRIVESTIGILISLSASNQLYKEILLNSSIYEKCIFLSTKNPISEEILSSLLEFFAISMKKIDTEQYINQIYKTLTLFIHEMFSKSPNCFYYSVIGICNITNLDNLPDKQYKRIINDGPVVKLIRGNVKQDKRVLFCSLQIFLNLLSLNDKIIETMLDLRVLDYYESLISQYMNDQELTPLILGGMGNIAGGKTEFKKLIINSTLFSEEEQNRYLTLLYSSEYEIKEQMITIISNLSLSKNTEILSFLNERGIINEILNLLINETNRIQLFNKYNSIITSFLLNFHKVNLQKNQKYYFVFEKYRDILSSNNPLIEEKDIEKMRAIIQEVFGNNLIR